VLLLVGLEVSPKAGHFLAFGVEREVEHRGRSEAEICAAVASEGGLGFPAHPFSEGSWISTRIAPSHGWADLDGCEITGIELWSAVTEAVERCASPRALLSFLRHPEEAMDHPPRRNLREWDRLCQRRRVVAIGGLDAHQTGVRLPGGRVLTPLPNVRFFRMLRTHVLLDHAPARRLEEDRALVFNALREGRCYLARDSLAPAGGFGFVAESNDQMLPMGG
jgi:hypothetical protein